MSGIRRLDHVAIVVADTERAVEYFSGRLGLEVVRTDVVEKPHVSLTYVDAGNVLIQLVEPLDGDSSIATDLAEHGEGLHHICFGVDDVAATALAFADPGNELPEQGGGRGRKAAFVPGPVHHGVLVECTEFNLEEDVHGSKGWLAD
jgi:methylmalonyl-CoA/ethylmalonyl-CoA epimerase